MTRDDDFTLRLAEWLEEGPFVAPERGVEAAIAHAWAHPRSRPHVPFGPRSRRWTGALPDTRLAWLVAALIALVLLGAALAAGSRFVAVIAPSCPRGSTPDEAGAADQLRPAIAQYAGPLAWDDRARRFVFIARSAVGGASTLGSIWTFDVCANDWREEIAAARVPDRGPIVYDEDSELTVAIGDYGVWTYDLPRNRWTRQPGRPPGWVTDAVYNPASGLVVGRDTSTGRMWSYDVETDTWLELDQGGSVPPAGGSSGFQLVGFDRSVERVVLTTDNGTWLFDPVAGTWTRDGGPGPVVFFIGGRQIAYDERRGQILVYGADTVAAYDSHSRTWQVLAGNPAGGWDRGAGYAMAYDPLNDRLVVVGGGRPDEVEGFVRADDVIAFDLETREWIELLAASDGG